MAFRHNKRSFTGDDSFQFACKHPRQLDISSQLAFFVETVSCNNVSGELHISGEESFKKSQGEDRLVTNVIATDQEYTNGDPGRNSSFSWVTGSISEEDNRSEPEDIYSFSPVLFEHDSATKDLMEPEDIYSSPFDYPHQRLVSIGPDYQADIPVWGLHGVNSSDYFSISASAMDSESVPSSAPSSRMADDNNTETLMMGTCIIPMPDADISDHWNGEVGRGIRIDCSCLDEGSIRCVKQHVTEAREKLNIALGEERFVELGFCVMGEDVACKWTEEEEQMFSEVVLNPKSADKNFWDHLYKVFSYRTKQDIVSYYYNVFKLRMRAEQNRADPLNVDSDEDEWQGSYGGDEFAISDEDEDSVVESPVDRYEMIYKEDYLEDDNDDDDISNYDNDNVDSGIDDVSVAQVSDESISRNSLDNCCFNPIVQFVGKNPQNGTEDRDSCTSYESQHNGLDSHCPADVAVTRENQAEREESHERLHEDYRNDSLSAMDDHGFVLEPCDPKVWDFGFFTGPKKELDLLPAGNWIEEVFGEEAWNKETKDDGPGFI